MRDKRSSSMYALISFCTSLVETPTLAADILLVWALSHATARAADLSTGETRVFLRFFNSRSSLSLYAGLGAWVTADFFFRGFAVVAANEDFGGPADTLDVSTAATDGEHDHGRFLGVTLRPCTQQPSLTLARWDRPANHYKLNSGETGVIGTSGRSNPTPHHDSLTIHAGNLPDAISSSNSLIAIAISALATAAVSSRSLETYSLAEHGTTSFFRTKRSITYFSRTSPASITSHRVMFLSRTSMWSILQSKSEFE